MIFPQPEPGELFTMFIDWPAQTEDEQDDERICLVARAVSSLSGPGHDPARRNHLMIEIVEHSTEDGDPCGELSGYHDEGSAYLCTRNGHTDPDHHNNELDITWQGWCGALNEDVESQAVRQPKTEEQIRQWAEGTAHSEDTARYGVPVQHDGSAESRSLRQSAIDDRVAELVRQHAKAAEPDDPQTHCDHVCLLKREHDGEHFYGYRLPSDADAVTALRAELAEQSRDHIAVIDELEARYSELRKRSAESLAKFEAFEAEARNTIEAQAAQLAAIFTAVEAQTMADYIASTCLDPDDPDDADVLSEWLTEHMASIRAALAAASVLPTGDET